MRAHHLNYGKGSAVLEIEECCIPGELSAKLRKVFGAPRYQPPMLPSAALRLTELTRRADVSYAEIRRVLDTEPLLAGQVLARAQSAALAGACPPRTLEEALTRLGLRIVGDMFLYEALNARVFRARGYEEPMRQLALHSSATACLARSLGRRTAMPDEYAFLCGLLHDVGVAACLIVIADGRRAPPSLVDLWPAIREVHAEAAGVLGRRWQLPPDVILVLENHHCHMVGGRAHPVAALVAVSDEVARRLGFGVDGADEAVELDPLLAAAGLTAAAVELAVAEAEPALKALHGP